ncbi:cbb3-type cytochrome c oxidase subunit 3 [Pseudorhodobacter sp. E13]|uniref:cbb3-type cytochrome c oxidase subunit 3 n=1 Tax=Pseudorhodobacter sp. E13 TaxID=2487931 RepID=UPI000F8E927A|nr:cbb3-type cytochrome c oxidase subunit 3 [Pseudorhodobacter sp. E13]RUS59774.1 cbb3-type cytochrome c oxidase subunit 3 [Pseudorhodobacter sp. E13]
METYSLLREFADSWMLIFLTSVFVGVVLWAFRPGSRPVHDDIAASIFRNDDKPADTAGRSEEART